MFGFYSDAGLTSLFTGNMIFQEPFDHSTLPDDQLIYFGSPDTVPDTKVQAASNPGVDQIAVSVVDADGGNANPATTVTFSDSADFTGKVAGDPISLGVEVLAGELNAVPIYIRYRDAGGVEATYFDLTIETNLLNKYEI